MSSQLDQFLDVILALGVVLAVAHLCGRLVQFVGQPKVVGEMVSGIMLGPSVLGALAPEWSAAIFTTEARSAIFMLSQIGLSSYMFLVGCDIDIALLDRSMARRAAALSFAGIAPSMILGGACGVMFFEALADDSQRSNVWQFAFYLGSALSLTAFPMLARILEEHRLAATSIGVLALFAASIDDAVAWCLLPLIVALAESRSIAHGFLPILGALGFVALCFFVFRPLFAFVGRKVEARGALLQEEFALVIVLLLVVIGLTDRIGVYSVFGGFVLGACMPRSAALLAAIRANMYQYVVVFFLPMFFASTGLGTEMRLLFAGGLLIPFFTILFVAFFGKYAVCAAAMRASGFSWRDASALGGLFNARGLMLLIFANVGVHHALIGKSVFALLVTVAVITTAAAMPIFDWSQRASRSSRLASHCPPVQARTRT
ncbi:MAG TPA: cation:proton antiporter [Methylosinus sp.]|jgi:Kef-type K+ transport system membrane component KefB|uniref:cation:proton antiporter domain-containing protein n=1 Tax=Methylosinus sp. TaxID=427 RepID=UPI002F94506C